MAQSVQQIAVEVAAPYTNTIHWVKYDSLGDAAKAVTAAVNVSVSHNQIGQIVSKYPEGYCATKGVFMGWSFRLYNDTNDSSMPPPTQPKAVKRNQKAVEVDVKPPSSDAWIHYKSSLAAAKGILDQFDVKFSSGSISRFVQRHPNGHIVLAKQNAGWMFRLHK